MRSSIRRASAIAGIILCHAIGAHAQGVNTPSSHFGALVIPTPDNYWETGFTTDRYTQYTKRSDSLDPARLRHYAMQSTVGTNIVHLAHSMIWRNAATSVRAGAFVGTAGDQPSNFFQNNFRHRDAGLQFVPVGETQSGIVYGGSLSADKWFDVKLLRGGWFDHNASIYVGADASLSTISSEGVFEFGVRSTRARVYNWTSPPTFSLGIRKGVYVRPGRAYDDTPRAAGATDVLAHTYTLVQPAVRFPLDRWLHSSSLVPAIDVGWTFDSGYFLAKDSPTDPESFRRIPEKFITYALVWGNGDVVIETYNDSFNNKDLGPSFGARVVTRWRNFRGFGL